MNHPNRILFGMIKLEFSLHLLKFYRTKESKKNILEVMSQFGLKIHFKGKDKI